MSINDRTDTFQATHRMDMLGSDVPTNHTRLEFKIFIRELRLLTSPAYIFVTWNDVAPSVTDAISFESKG